MQSVLLFTIQVPSLIPFCQSYLPALVTISLLNNRYLTGE